MIIQQQLNPKLFLRKKWNICFDKNVSNAFFAKICSALTENMNRDLHSVHWEKVTKVPFMFMTEFPLKKWPKFRSWTWTERELNGKSSVPTMLWLSWPKRNYINKAFKFSAYVGAQFNCKWFGPYSSWRSSTYRTQIFIL